MLEEDFEAERGLRELSSLNDLLISFVSSMYIVLIDWQLTSFGEIEIWILLLLNSAFKEKKKT